MNNDSQTSNNAKPENEFAPSQPRRMPPDIIQTTH